MDGQAIVQLIGATLGAGGVVAIINGIFGRKKMSADVVKTINEAADTAVKRVEEDNDRLRNENEQLDTKVDDATRRAREAEARSWRLTAALRQYVAYAHRQAEVIRSLGGVIEDPPDVAAELLT